jgi:hypothetical protein
VAREDFDDPDLVAEDTQLLTSHRRDRVRVFNLGIGQFLHATSGHAADATSSSTTARASRRAAMLQAALSG